MAYEKFYRFYDLVMGDRSAAAHFVRDLLELHRPQARTVLELACGTGSILGFLADRYDVTGLDRSGRMLSLARRKLPHLRFYRQDMTRFALNKKFDAIICVFDSLNHLTAFDQWLKVFRRVKRHLNRDGIFVFDINTVGKLRRLAQGPPWIKEFGRDKVIIDVVDRQRGRFAWGITIFEHRRAANYRLVGESIEERAYALKQICQPLGRVFRTVKLFDPTGKRPTDESERVYFVCKR